MPSAVLPSAHSYPTMRLAPQPVHQRCVHPGPLVLGTAPRKSRTPTADRDRTVSRRSKPSSRTTLIGEQPNRSEERRVGNEGRDRWWPKPTGEKKREAEG